MMIFDELRHLDARTRTLLAALLVALLVLAGGGCSEAEVGPDPASDAETPVVDMGDGGASVTDQDPDAEPDLDPVVPDLDPVVPDLDLDLPDEGVPDMEPDGLLVRGVLPARGPVDGGTAFVLEGTGFSQGTRVFFGSQEAEVTLTLDGELIGAAPAARGPGPVTVKLVDPDLGSVSLPDGFTYFQALRIDSVSPSKVPVDGGVEVTLRGTGLTPETRVSFGGRTARRHVFVDSSLMRVLAPAHPAGQVDLRATNRDETVTRPGAVTYFAPLRLDTLQPSSGPTAGGQSVTLTGSGFGPGLTVRFGNAKATVTQVGPGGDTAQVTTPAHATGTVDVSLETAGGEAVLLPGVYSYADAGAPLQLHSVTPKRGPASGGIEVVLLGMGLEDPDLTFHFDAAPVTTVLERGPGHVRLRAPAHASGTVDVIARDPGDAARASTLADAFTYLPDLFVDQVTPDQGPGAGGTQVVLRGEGFTGTQKVLFGGVAAAFTVDSDLQITATTPAHADGTVDLTVVRDDGLDATLYDGYTFTESLHIYGFSPVRGAVAGGTLVEIRGRGFLQGQVEALFDNQPALSVSVLDSQTLAVRTPPHASGPVTVAVARADGSERAEAPHPFRYYNPGARFGGAWGSEIERAVNVTVYSDVDGPLEGAFVMLSTNQGSPYTGLTDVNGMIILSGPDILGEQTVTATASGHSTGTVTRVDAENITILLTKYPECTPVPEQCNGLDDDCDGLLDEDFPEICFPPEPQPAVFTGTLTGLNKIAIPGPNEFLMAQVFVTWRDPWARTVRTCRLATRACSSRTAHYSIQQPPG